MLMVMCEACGNFLRGTLEGEAVVPIREECPDCGASEFRAFVEDED